MDRIIRVTGRGRLTVQPDTIQLLLTLTGINEIYGAAVEESAEAVQRLRDCLAEIDFGRESLQTRHFSISSKYEGYQDPQGFYKQRFLGFEYDHRLELEIPRDPARLGQALTAFLQSGVPVEFQIAYLVKDPRQAKNDLIKSAVDDAKTKARQLADAAGVRLGKIVHMACPQEEISLRQEGMQSTRVGGQTAYTSVSPDLEPADIDLSESVEVTWEIQ